MTRFRRAAATRAGIAAVLVCLVSPGSARAVQEESAPLEADSVALLEEAKRVQREFERFREQRLPPEWSGFGGRCDALVGRMCLRHGDGEAPPVEPDPIEVEMARMDMLRTLDRIASRVPRDRWILGQRVHYLREQGEWLRAEALAQRCHDDDEWWCRALEGYLLQSRGESLEAESVFRDALARMPEEERERWTALDHLLDEDGRELFEDADPAERATLRRRLWLLADPLYLVEGNDREAEQYARRTLVRIREAAENAYDIPWEEDLEELVVRYGGEVGWERGRPVRPPSGLLRDNRFIVGRHRPHGREFMPAGAFLKDPADIPVRAWEIEDRAPRTGYAAWYAPVITAMDAQVARFRRGDSLLVVAGYRPPPPSEEAAVPPTVRETAPGADPFAAFAVPPPPPPETGGAVESGTFLFASDGERIVDRRGSEREGSVAVRVPNGEYLFGLEVLDDANDRGWRVRSGVRQEDLPRGLAGVSDVVLLDPSGDLPENLEEALPRVLGSTRVRSGEPVVAGWEVYGLRVGERASVGIAMQAADPGLLERAARFLRLTAPEAPLELSWEEAGPDELGTVFRAVALALPQVEPGEYDLILTVRLPGRSPIDVATRLVVEE